MPPQSSGETHSPHFALRKDRTGSPASGERSDPPPPLSYRIADKLETSARFVLWLLAFGIMVVIPWAFGGNGYEGYLWIVWTGRICILPLVLWAAGRIMKRRSFGVAVWLPLVCWSLLAIQVIVSYHNPSHEAEAPWVGDGFKPIAHDETLPSTAFDGGTLSDGHLWIAFALLALTARAVGLRTQALRRLLWCFVLNATVLALIGIPFKFSGEPKILGRWEMQEWYFYSTFIYHNHWTAFAIFAVAAAVGLACTTSRLSSRIILTLAGVALAASAPLSFSRLGTAAMLAFGLFVVVTLIRRRHGMRLSFRKNALVLSAGVLSLALVAGTILYFYKTRGGPGGHRTHQMLGSNPFGLRQTFVEDTIPMFKAKPWFGWGLGAFGAGFRSYQRPETRVVHNEGRVTLYDHIHNDWLERLTELGIVGFTLFLTPGLLWWHEGRHRTADSPLRFWLLVGAGAILIFALGDMAFTNNVVAATFGLFFALSLGSSHRKSRP